MQSVSPQLRSRFPQEVTYGVACTQIPKYLPFIKSQYIRANGFNVPIPRTDTEYFRGSRTESNPVPQITAVRFISRPLLDADRSPCDFWLWNLLKLKVYRDKPPTLKGVICQHVIAMTQDMLLNAVNGVLSCVTGVLQVVILLVSCK